MASVRPHVMPKPEYKEDLSGELIEEKFTLKEEDIPTKVLEIIPSGVQGTVNISGAKILVSGGRGMHSPENFKLLAGTGGPDRRYGLRLTQRI